MQLIAKKIKELGYELPGVSVPVASYIPAVRIGNLIYTSGSLPIKDGKLIYTGKIGEGFNSEQYGYKASELCILNALSVINDLAGLDNVKQIIKLTGFVNSSDTFTGQPKVINGASDLLVKIFEDRGKHARSAVGAVSLPLGASVELELIVEITC
ncbi:MAG TPA: RidA family protein [Candidatus Gastranaerophilales bacterium]|nr:RidA family protein [Candidatus Gastranaerophilales bacterium]